MRVTHFKRVIHAFGIVRSGNLGIGDWKEETFFPYVFFLVIAVLVFSGHYLLQAKFKFDMTNITFRFLKLTLLLHSQIHKYIYLFYCMKFPSSEDKNNQKFVPVI